jgi:hypothetical protein
LQKLPRKTANRAGNRFTRRVIDRDPQMNALSRRGQEFGALNISQKKFWDTIAPANDLQSDTALPEFFGFEPKVGPHYRGQEFGALNISQKKFWERSRRPMICKRTPRCLSVSVSRRR